MGGQRLEHILWLPTGTGLSSRQGLTGSLSHGMGYSMHVCEIKHVS
jgi:hypothetical protein